MSEQTVEVTPEATETTTPENEPFDADRAQAKIKKANDEARSLRARLKELEPLAQEAERLRESQKSEAERISEARQAAEARAAESEARALRLEVAFDKGLTPAQAKRLVGESREELEADADEILRDFPTKSDGRPKGDADLGVRPIAPPNDPRAADLAQIEADIKAGKRR
jgi:chromosome segregation ATPase